MPFRRWNINLGSAVWETIAYFLLVLPYIASLVWNIFFKQFYDQESLEDSRQFKVHIYKDELERIRSWVQQKENIETGGDLFGLWMDKYNVVVQLVLGPGQNCRRTTTSFYQDLDYLATVGDFLTRKHGLCNIGQWHSHHRLNLPRPSIGDENTVWTNMPILGIDRFVVLIATIKDSNVNINCFLFEVGNESKEQFPVLEGEICVIEHETDSPIRMCSSRASVLERGMEREQAENEREVTTVQLYQSIYNVV